MIGYTFENTGNGVVTRYTHPTFGKVVTISEEKWDAYIAKVKAEAWDEGHAEGETYGAQVAEFGIGYAIPVKNYYRETEQ